MKKVLLLSVLCFLLVLPIVLSIEDQYKPYLHKAVVPEHPKLTMYGQYNTNLFSGIATYSYPILVPKGTNDLTPQLSLSYNSEGVKQRPGIVGAGWSLTQNYLFREVNNSLNNTSDDIFKLVLGGSIYELSLVNGVYHTKVESYLRIEKLNGAPNRFQEYWLVTSKDGTRYQFGFSPDSELESNSGYNYSVKWYLDSIEDTHGNKIYYTYLKNPYSQDVGAIYLKEIIYNNDKKRKINFEYEATNRPDARLVYDNSNKLLESRRLSVISMFSNDQLVRKYTFSYLSLNTINSLSSISKIAQYGSDNSSILYNISFEYYSDLEGYYNANTYVPFAVFTDYNHTDFGVRLLDVNNDGFVDILKARGQDTQKKAFINNHYNGWINSTDFISPVYISIVSGTTEIDNGVRFADVNNDGLIDLLHGIDSVRNIYLNNASGWVLNASWVLPISFIESNYDSGAVLVDFNGDGKTDILQAKDSTRKAWLNTGAGWTDVNYSWQSPEPFIVANKDSGARLEDLNGDGLPDIARATDVGGVVKTAYLNTGLGWVNYSSFIPPDYFTTSAKADTGARFLDANGDGLSDLIYDYVNGSTDISVTWLNNGSGWVSMNSSWHNPLPFTKNGYNLGRRMGDANGDGFADIIVAYDNSTGEHDLHTYIKNISTSYLLKKITNEYGGVIDINYAASTLVNNSPNGVSQLGFNMWLVNTYHRNNSLIGEFTNTGRYSYQYFGGKYDYKNREFRGFTKVKETQPDEDYTLHYFKQDDALKGKEYLTENYDSDGNIYSKSQNNFNYTYNSYYVISLQDSTTYLYDKSTDAKITNISFTYDNYGNPISKIYWGDILVTGDEKYEYYTYSYNFNKWILDKVWKYELYGADNKTLAKRTSTEYDNKGWGGAPIKGDVTKIKEWNSNGNDIVKSLEYDAYGNMVKSTDALGHTTTYRYGLRDTTFTYADKVTNTLGQYVDFKYDLATGNLLWSEKEGIRTSYNYDQFGRISEEIQPLDDETFPTKTYSYYFDGAAPEIIKVSQRENANNYTDAYFYYGGFGNVIQIKNTIENNQSVVKNIFYDAQDRVKYEQNLYFDNCTNCLSTPGTANKTYYTYDPLDRVTKVTNPDGTSINTVFNKWTISDYDANNNRHDYLLDAFGRILNVIEYNSQPLFNNRPEIYNTSYFYDTNDNLIKIVDNEGNEFKFSYDSLGRKIKLEDPDLGIWIYRYDANGNLIEQNNSKGQLIKLSYDSLNRILHKNSTNVNITFSYDGKYWGTLTNLTMGNVVYQYNYDKRMRTISIQKTINGRQVGKSLDYDSANRLVQQALPSMDLEYYYNKQGKLSRINNFINNSNYNAFGSIINRSFSNGLTTSFTYNSSNNRLTQIASGNIQNLRYSYDKVGNILTISDSVAARQYNMSYDALDRLVTTTINNDLYQYEYDSLGNIKRIVNGNTSRRLNYNGKIPHAPSEIVESSNTSAGIYDLKDLNTNSKNRTFEFFLLKEKINSVLNVNWSADLGQNKVSSNRLVNLSTVPVLVIIENNYTTAGEYLVNISTLTDANSFRDKFGIDAKSLGLVTSTKNTTYLDFWITKDITELVLDANWYCSNGITSSKFNITNDTLIIVEYEYSTPGDKQVTCNINSTNGKGNRSTEFNLKGLEIEDYDLVTVDTNQKVAVYSVKNYYNNLTANITTVSDLNSNSRLVPIASDTSVMVIIELNYTTDGTKQVDINSLSSITNDSYRDTFTLKALEIENYDRVNFNSPNQVLVFDVYNRWPSNLSVGWNLTDPSVRNSTYLNKSQFVMVIVEENYSTQGRHEPEIKVYSGNFLTRFKDRFDIFLVQLLQLQVLKQSKDSTVTELIAKSTSGNKPISWKYDSGREVINSTRQLAINESVLIIIESNYTSNSIYSVNASINSSTLKDNVQGVVLT